MSKLHCEYCKRKLNPLVSKKFCAMHLGIVRVGTKAKAKDLYTARYAKEEIKKNICLELKRRGLYYY